MAIGRNVRSIAAPRAPRIVELTAENQYVRSSADYTSCAGTACQRVRLSARRLAVLESIKVYLKAHPNTYDRAEFPVRSSGALINRTGKEYALFAGPADQQERRESDGALSRSARLAGENRPAGRASGEAEALRDPGRERTATLRLEIVTGEVISCRTQQSHSRCNIPASTSLGRL